MTVLSIAIFTLGVCIIIEGAEILNTLSEEKLCNSSFLGESRVVGGRDAIFGSIPYIASLQSQGNWHSCGGSIIDKDWILTAAHCTNGNTPSYYRIRVGTTKLSEPGPYYLADKIYQHCKHGSPRFQNDIALIHLKSSIEFNDTVQPVKLPSSPTNNGVHVKLSGWGQLGKDRGPPNHLQTIDLKYLTNNECKRKLSNSPYVGPGIICSVASEGKGACYGDSGGPLVTSDGHLVGVANWVFPCALGLPDAYASTWYFRDWINSIMSGNIDCSDDDFLCEPKCKERSIDTNSSLVN